MKEMFVEMIIFDITSWFFSNSATSGTEITFTFKFVIHKNVTT